MVFDIFAVVLAVVLAGLGYRSGALTQINRLVGLTLAFFAAPAAAAVLKELLFEGVEAGQPLVEWALLVGGWATVYLLVAVLGYLIVRLMRLSSEELSRKDQLWGGLLGALKGLVIVYLAASSVLLIEEPLRKADPKDVLHLQRSGVVDAARAYQVVVPWALPDLDRLQELLADARTRDPEALRDDPAMSGVMTRDDVKALMDDPEIIEAVEEDNISRLLARPEVRDLLSDPEFLKALREATR